MGPRLDQDLGQSGFQRQTWRWGVTRFICACLFPACCIEQIFRYFCQSLISLVHIWGTGGQAQTVGYSGNHHGIPPKAKAPGDQWVIRPRPVLFPDSLLLHPPQIRAPIPVAQFSAENSEGYRAYLPCPGQVVPRRQQPSLLALGHD